MTVKAISESEFSSLLQNNFVFESKPHLGICVSGGADSMALMILMKEWIKRKEGKLTIFHFNHNLRKNSNEESVLLSNELKKQGLEFKILINKRKKPKTKIMEISRNLRYSEIIKACKDLNILHLMTAHHLDDNIETFIMRQKRKSSSTGLSSIPYKRVVTSLQILRPLLNFKKERLVQTCISRNLNWFEDPSNKNKSFERVRIRNELNSIGNSEKTNIVKQLRLKKQINKKLEKKIYNFFLNELTFFSYGVFEIRTKSLVKQKIEVQIEILKNLLTTNSGKFYPPRRTSIQVLLKKIHKKIETNHTLHSSFISIGEDKIKIYREIKKNRNLSKVNLRKGDEYLWDNRFYIKSKKFNITCSQINKKNWIDLCNEFPLKKSEINFLVVQSLPLLEINGERFIPFVSENKLKKKNIEFFFNPTEPLSKKIFFRY